MSPEDPARAPDTLAARFLGRSAGAGGPFALLGVGHDTQDPTSLRAAAARRLAQIDRHPMRLTPEADELRLAVHAAMAQLADPALHAVLVRHWPAGEAEATPAAWRSHLSAVSDQMARQARLIVGASGGWNTRAKKRLAHLARLHRVNANDLVRSLRPEGASASASSSVGRRGMVPAMVFPEISGPGSSGRVWLLIHLSLTVLLVGMASAVVRELARPDPTPVAGVAQRDLPVSGAGSEASPVPRARASIMHHAALEQELTNTLRAVADDPEAGVARLNRALETLFARWPEMPSDARDRIVASVARIIAALPEAWRSAAEAGVGAGVVSRDVTTRIGASAAAARLGEDPALPRDVRDAYLALVSGIDPGGGFDAAAVDALRVLITAGNALSAAQWGAWSVALDAGGSVPAVERTRIRLDALDDQLRRPTRPGDAWRAVATTLASGLSWRAGAPARAWLLAQLADEAVPTARLAELTAVLATEVSVPGVDASMVLAPDADASDRAVLAAAYRAAWAAGVGNETVRSEVLAALVGAAERAERSVPDASDRVAVLVSLARANAAGAALHAGDDALAAEILAMPAFTPPASPPPSTGRSIGGLTDDWGLTLINSQSPELASAMLIRAMQDRAPFSPLAAEAVVSAAQSGGNRALRDQARALAVASAWDAQILLAIERAAARRPTIVLGEIVTAITGAALPAPRDEDWADRVRSALLPRIAELVAGSDPTDLVYAELELGELAARRAGLDSGAPHPRSILTETERLLRANTLRGNDPLSPDTVRSRQAARASTAGARAQLIAVQHRSLVDALAGVAVVRGARPRPMIDRRLATLAADWASARGVIDQLLATHRAEADLWRSLLEGAV